MIILNSFGTLFKRNGNELPTLLFFNDEQCQLRPDFPDVFAAYFESVYIEKNINVQSKPSLNQICISNYVMSISTIYEEMANIDITKGPGPDGIPPLVFLIIFRLYYYPVAAL